MSRYVNPTFNIPDYREKTFWFNAGHSCGFDYAGYIPNITGSIGYAEGVGGIWGAFYKNGGSGGNFLRANTGSKQETQINASRSSYIYGNSHDILLPDDSVVPRSLSCRGLIKY